MITKVYDKVKRFFQENWKFLVVFVVLGVLFTYEFPYYIDAPGGLMNVSDKIEMVGGNESDGSFNLAYVSELRATIPTLLVAFFNPSWDVLKEEDMLYDNETIRDLTLRDQLLLKEALGNATIVGFDKAGASFEVASEKVYVSYKTEDAITDLKVGDQFLSVAGEDVLNKEGLSDLIQSLSVGEEVSIKVLNRGKEYVRTATIQEVGDRKLIGVVLTQVSDVKTDPLVEFHFSKNESGPSGGLMTALSIYNMLVKEDLTRGKKIVGTGTIELDGSVGSIGGVKYKLKGAVRKKAQIFFVPAGENYEEALKLVDKYQYDIQVVSVAHIDDAILYLKNLDD